MNRRGTIVWLACATTFAMAAAALAHTTSTGLATLTVTGSRLGYRLTLVLNELPDEPARLLAAAADGDADSLERVVAALHERVRVRVDDRTCRPGRAVLQGSRLGDARVTLELMLHCPEAPAQLVVHDDWFEVFGSHYRTLARIESPGGVHEVAFLPDAREATIDLAPGGRRSQASFFWLGVEHILTGYDHLLFLAVLLLRGGRVVALAKLVTAFTLAHSVTLAVTVLGLVALPDRLVEVIIAASITWVALENLVWRAVPAWRWVVTFVFGLVHGFGFASALRPLDLPSWNLAIALLGFNLGVEAGQGMVIAVTLPVLVWLGRFTWQPCLVRTMSLALALVGVVWFVQRLV